MSPHGPVTFLDDGVALGIGNALRSKRIVDRAAAPGKPPHQRKLCRRRQLHGGRLRSAPAERRLHSGVVDLGRRGQVRRCRTTELVDPTHRGCHERPTANDCRTPCSRSILRHHGMAAAQLGLQEDTGSGWTDVPLHRPGTRRHAADRRRRHRPRPGSSTGETAAATRGPGCAGRHAHHGRLLTELPGRR